MEWKLKGYFRVQALHKLNEILRAYGDDHGRINSIKNKIAVISKIKVPDYFQVKKCEKRKRNLNTEKTFLEKQVVQSNSFSDYSPCLSKILMETYGNLKDTLTSAIPRKSQKEKISGTKDIKKTFFISEITKNKNDSPKKKSETINCEQKRVVTLPSIINNHGSLTKKVKGFNHYYKVINLLEKKRNDFQKIVYRDIYNYYNISEENTINTDNIEFTNNYLNSMYKTSTK